MTGLVQKFQVYYFGSKKQSVTYHDKNTDFLYLLSSPNESCKKQNKNYLLWASLDALNRGRKPGVQQHRLGGL